MASQASRAGYLDIDGIAIGPAEIGPLVGCTEQEALSSLNTLVKYKFLSKDGGFYIINDFIQQQGLDKAERYRNKKKAYMQKYRMKHKLGSIPVTSYTKVTDNEPQPEAGVETEKDPVKRLAKVSKLVAGKKYLSKQGLQDMWNDKVTGVVPALRHMTDERYKSFKKRCDEGMELPDILEEVEMSDFLRYGSGNSSWKFNFDWLISNGKNWVKIMEGVYRNPGSEKAVNVEEDPEYQKKIKELEARFK